MIPIIISEKSIFLVKHEVYFLTNFLQKTQRTKLFKKEPRDFFFTKSRYTKFYCPLKVYRENPITRMHYIIRPIVSNIMILTFCIAA